MNTRLDFALSFLLPVLVRARAAEVDFALVDVLRGRFLLMRPVFVLDSLGVLS